MRIFDLFKIGDNMAEVSNTDNGILEPAFLFFFEGRKGKT